MSANACEQVVSNFIRVCGSTVRPMHGMVWYVLHLAGVTPIRAVGPKGYHIAGSKQGLRCDEAGPCMCATACRRLPLVGNRSLCGFVGKLRGRLCARQGTAKANTVVISQGRSAGVGAMYYGRFEWESCGLVDAIDATHTT